MITGTGVKIPEHYFDINAGILPAARTCLALLLLVSVVTLNSVQAASPRDIDIEAGKTMKKFRARVQGANEILKQAKGVLIFPEIIKTGVGRGGEYADGELQINSGAVDYFTIFGASLGLQLDGHLQSIILIFMQNEPLNKFLAGYGWDFSVVGAVTKMDSGDGNKPVLTASQDPIMGFLIADDGRVFRLINPAKDQESKPGGASPVEYRKAAL